MGSTVTLQHITTNNIQPILSIGFCCMFLFTEPVLTLPVDRGFLGIHEGAQHLVGLPLHRQVQVLHVEPHVDTPGIPGWKALEDGSWEKGGLQSGKMWGKCGENDGNDFGHLWVSQKKLEHQENKE